MSAYLNLEYTDWAQFKRDADKASQRLLMAETLMAGDRFLASIFFNGDEPDWSHESQRESAFELRDAMARLAVELGVVSIGEANRLEPYSERETGAGPASAWNEIRKRILERDGEVCGHCGATEDLAVDHKLPRSRGGADDDENLWVLCRSCNSSKGTKTVEEWKPELVDGTAA